MRQFFLLFRMFGIMVMSVFSGTLAYGQQTPNEIIPLTVNENVTTVITASEPIRLVDISTDRVVGDKPIENTLRLKPKEGGYEDGQVLAIVTIVTERYRVQYSLMYTTRLSEAVADKEIAVSERTPYHNPSTSMSTDEMVYYARKIWNSAAHYRNIKTNAHHLTMRLNNIYAVGDYFFIDFSVENRTHVGFDIDMLRFTLCDKKTYKSTNAQILELEPVLLLDKITSFRRGWRQVAVIKKMTFPNDKVITIELCDKQISGRNIQLTIDYEDVLDADGFSDLLLMEK